MGGFTQTKRKEHQIDELEKELNVLDWKMKFIKGVIDGTIIVNNRNKENINEQLVKLEFPKLSAELQQQQLHNMRMMNLNQGLVEHPEERDCYLKQLESLQLQTHYNII